MVACSDNRSQGMAFFPPCRCCVVSKCYRSSRWPPLNKPVALRSGSLPTEYERWWLCQRRIHSYRWAFHLDLTPAKKGHCGGRLYIVFLFFLRDFYNIQYFALWRCLSDGPLCNQRDIQGRYDQHCGGGWKRISDSACTWSDTFVGGAFLLAQNEEADNILWQNHERLRSGTNPVRIEKRIEFGL